MATDPAVKAPTVTAAAEPQQKGEPVHRWPVIEQGESEEWSESYRTVGQFMSTDLFTMRPDDLVDLAASVMDWRHIRHVPVVDEQGRLVGLLSHRTLLRLLARGVPDGEPVAIRQIITMQALNRLNGGPLSPFGPVDVAGARLDVPAARSRPRQFTSSRTHFFVGGFAAEPLAS